MCTVVPAFSLAMLTAGAALAQSPSGQVVVTASRTEQILTDVLPHTTVLGRDAIEQSQVLDLPTLLAREAGFQFTQTGGTGSQATAFLRGAASLQVLVLVDGVPMTKQDTTGAVSLKHIMLDQVDRIEIGERRAFTVPIEFPALSFGDQLVRGTVKMPASRRAIENASP